MKTIAVIATLLALFAISACGVKTSGVRTLGGETYTITVTDLDDTTAKGTALGLAENHCNEMAKSLLVIKIFKQHQVRYRYDVTFQCVEADDPRLENPEYETIYRSE